RLFVELPYLLPEHLRAGVVRANTRVRNPLVREPVIRAFGDRLHPGMSDAEPLGPLSFASFNALFTRGLVPGARPIDPDPGSLVSPVDGTVSQIGRLDGSWMVQAKGRAYTLESLLAADLSWAQHFKAGAFATFYLAPFNYP